ncbi:hypothetical protein GCM10027266_18900 [Arenimonas alkanexedens]
MGDIPGSGGARIVTPGGDGFMCAARTTTGAGNLGEKPDSVQCGLVYEPSWKNDDRFRIDVAA